MTNVAEQGSGNKGAYRVACDVGGTFTDLCFLEEQTGTLHVSKTPTTSNPIDGVIKGIELGGDQTQGYDAFRARYDVGDQRAYHPAFSACHNGHHEGLQGRNRNPTRNA